MNEWIGQVLPFWKDLTETEKQMLLTHTALEEYEKGVLLHIDGGDCAGVQIVKEGQVVSILRHRAVERLHCIVWWREMSVS